MSKILPGGITAEEAKEEILKLKHGEHWTWPDTSDCGHAEIWRIWDTYIVLEVPCYGGIPQFHRGYRKGWLDELIETVGGWT